MQEANRIFILPEGFVEPHLGQETAESETRLPHSLQVIKAIENDRASALTGQLFIDECFQSSGTNSVVPMKLSAEKVDTN